MTILFWDTETTGFLDERLPRDHEAQPYIVQLAALLCEDDGRQIADFSLIVNPGVEIPEKAAAIHGITTERAIHYGCEAGVALALFSLLYRRADLLCAHNAKFDKGVTEVAIARQYGKTMPIRKPIFCTMEAATPIVNLPPTERMIAAGFNKPKPPKLEECVRHFFNEEMVDAHDAKADLQACRRVYFHLMSLKDAAA